MIFVCSYGNEFIQEAYLYHFSRTDIKHNFSVYFYMLFVTQGSLLSRLVSLMAFLPQFLLVLSTAIVHHQDITMCLFIQTFVFVAFNKVCTSQYFLWYLALLPLVIPFSKLNLHQLFVLTSLWFIGQVSFKTMYCGFVFVFVCFVGIVADSSLLSGVSRLRYLCTNMAGWTVVLWHQLFYYISNESPS